jgi:phosphatidylglycerophosphate synthase
VIIQASDFGKATMIAEVIAVALLIVNWPAVSVPLGQAVLMVAILLSLASGAIYFHKFWRCIDLAK